MADSWNDQTPPFLDKSPAPWAARGLAWIIIALFAAGAIAAVAIQVPETVSSRFVLIPMRGADQIRAARDGVVAEILVSDAQPIAAGAPLFVLRSAVVGDRSAELRSLETQAQGAGARLDNERQRAESQRRADEEEEARLRARFGHVDQRLAEQRALRETRQARYRATLAIFENDVEIGRRETEFKQKALGVATELAERTERYYNQGVISWLEYNNRQLEASKLAVELQQLERHIDTARLRVSQLKSEEAQQEIESRLTLDQLTSERRELQASMNKLRHESAARRRTFVELERSLREDATRATIRTAALQAELQGSRGNELSVVAPCQGTMLKLWVQRPGAVVKESDPLADVACGAGPLQAELTMPASGVGHVKAGHPVKLLYDTFPYQRHGVRRATVRWVSPTGTSQSSGTGQSYRVLADIEDEAEMVRGERRALTAGMGGRAQVVMGRRSLITYAFEPLRQLKESLSDAPPKRGTGP
jgi:multidrug efflux pump subunit AcrA (membrane-fusion protein)